MDALALLCNLYGDGPATLKRLRSAGCDSFSALEDLEPDQLAEILGTNEAASRRFLREARLLVERLAESELEHEERPPLITPLGESQATLPEAALPRPVAAAVAMSPQALARPVEQHPGEQHPGEQHPGEQHPGEQGPGEDAGASREDRSSALIDRVLATWRERDATVGAERDVEFSERDRPVDSEEIADAETLLGTPLRPRLVDGLDRTLCESLKRAGFPTIEELADADPMVVSRNSGAELTRVMRLQFLARRLIGERGQAETLEPPEVLKPAGRPWPLARTTPAAALPARTREAPLPAEAFRAPGEAEGAKFSISETPFGAASSQLADELDQAGRRLRGSDADPSGPREGTGGPFA